MFWGDRSKRVAKIAASAAQHLEPDEEVLELIQVQTGWSAERTGQAVRAATEHLKLTPIPEDVRSAAVLATDRNVYVVWLTGTRLLDVDSVASRSPLNEVQISLEHDGKMIVVNGASLWIMKNYDKQLAHLKELLAERGVSVGESD